MHSYRRTLATGLWCLTLILTVWGCGSSRKTTQSATGRIERRPLTETSEEKVKTDAMMINAKMLQLSDRSDGALRIYRQILQRDESYSAAHYEISRIMSRNGMADSAIAHTKAAIKCDKENIWYWRQLATLYQNAHDNLGCISAWERLVELRPDNVDYYFELSNAYLRANNLKKAIDALDRVEKRLGVIEDVSLQKAKIWNYTGRADKAAEEIEALALAMPMDTRYNGMIAETYMESKQYAKAKKYYDRVLAADPEHEYIHVSLAEYYRAVGQHDKAYEELRTAFLQDKLTATNKLQILTNFYTSEEFYGVHSKYGFDLLNIAMSQCDDSVTYAAFYGDVLMRQGKSKEACHQFSLALSRDSSRYDVWEALLVSEMQAGADSAQLTRDAQRAAALFPLHPLPYFVMGVAAFDNGDYASALKYGKQCEQVGFDKNDLEAETYSLLAQAYYRLNDDQCVTYFEKYLALNPNDASMLNSYAWMLASKGKELDKAERMSRRSIDIEQSNPHYLDTYAWILHLKGNDKEALKYIEQAITNGGQDTPEIMEHWKEIKREAEK